MSIEDIIDENDHLRAELAETKAYAARLEAALRRMAAELDSRAANHVNPAQETREWVGTVEWRGSVADYEANAGGINHQLAQTIHKMAIEADQARNQRNSTESDQKEAQNALPQATPIIEADGREDAPEGRR